jgi:hypothetical protein
MLKRIFFSTIVHGKESLFIVSQTPHFQEEYQFRKELDIHIMNIHKTNDGRKLLINLNIVD